MKSNIHKVINEDAKTSIKQLSRVALTASKKAQAGALGKGLPIVTAFGGRIIKTKPDGSKHTIETIQSKSHKVINPGKVIKFKFK